MQREIHGLQTRADTSVPTMPRPREVESVTRELLRALSPKLSPSRKPRQLVTRSGARVRGFHHSLKHQKSLAWETVEERALIQTLDASPGTTQLASQPVTLEIALEEDTFEYTPDVVVERYGQITVFECKPLQVIESELWVDKLNAIEMHFGRLGVNFIALPNEVRPNKTVQANIDRVLLGGRPVQYPMFRRKEDWALLIERKPTTFRGVDRADRPSGCFGRTGTQVGVCQHERTLDAKYKNLFRA
jgi:hypothetical protein